MLIHNLLLILSLSTGAKVAIGIGLVLGVIAFRVPSVALALAIIGALVAYQVPVSIVGVVAAVLAFITLPILRAPTVSRMIMTVANRLRLFPKVSATEKAALDAGTVWMDKELFSGDPSMKTLMSQHLRPLSPDEQAFLDGPVAQLCELINDWEIQEQKAIPDHIWAFIKEHRFLGMIIPRAYGGLELSALGHSRVIEAIASVSPTVAITVMVPNSLGPAELLLHYGTQAQKDRYLRRLATGDEIPCFGLTEPTAGSDAGGLQSNGVVFKGNDGELYIRFNWNKRWITLSGISTIIGLAFLLRDPDKLLGGAVERGITCALIPTNTPGVDVSRRHDPLGVPFVNCPTTGTDVVMPISCIIGEAAGVGNGWSMLMDCLSAGRGISLPSLSVGGAKTMTAATSAFAVIREQFGMAIGQFEGIHEPLARIVGKTVLLQAARDYTCGAIDQGEKPSVVSAIIKWQSTELFRTIVNDSMDILGGAGITQGPRNVVASAYKAAPIGITVEGANILTRTLIIFGQGALRCHPYAYDEVSAAESGDYRKFDRAFFGHIRHVIRTKMRVTFLTLSGGLLSCHYGGTFSAYKRRLVWSSAVFALLADIAMLYFGGALKAKQMITGRLADMLSWMYLATSTLAYAEKNADNKALRPVIRWALAHCFYNVHVAVIGYFENMGLVTRWFVAPLYRLIPLGKQPSDALGRDVALAIQNNVALRDSMIQGSHVSTADKPGISQLDDTYRQLIAIKEPLARIRKAVKAKVLPKKKHTLQVLDAAVAAKIVSHGEALAIRKAEERRGEAIQVDSFEVAASGFPD